MTLPTRYWFQLAILAVWVCHQCHHDVHHVWISKLAFIYRLLIAVFFHPRRQVRRITSSRGDHHLRSCPFLLLYHDTLLVLYLILPRLMLECVLSTSTFVGLQFYTFIFFYVDYVLYSFLSLASSSFCSRYFHYLLLLVMISASFSFSFTCMSLLPTLVLKWTLHYCLPILPFLLLLLLFLRSFLCSSIGLLILNQVPHNSFIHIASVLSTYNIFSRRSDLVRINNSIIIICIWLCIVKLYVPICNVSVSEESCSALSAIFLIILWF